MVGQCLLSDALPLIHCMNISPPKPPTQAKVSPAKALQEIIKRQVSGKLTVSDPEHDGMVWQLYLGKGQIHFAQSNLGQQQRTFSLLQQYSPKLERPEWGKSSSDYQYLLDLYQSDRISKEELNSLLLQFTQEALTQVLAIPKANVQFQKDLSLEPTLLAAPLIETIVPVREDIGEWLKLRPEIASPLVFLTCVDVDRLEQELSEKTENPEFVRLLIETIAQNLCLYEVAAALKVDALELARLLHPTLKQGLLKADTFNSFAGSKPRPVIACIDDSNTVQRQIKLTLEAVGYEVLGLVEPARALTAMVRKKPQVILLDINMPDIDGYQLCRQLRQSALFQKTPIVMLTGRDGNIDRLLAKMAGATDYFTKPIQTQQLLNLVNQLVAKES
jgi:twitching motility two-component system response regulator PilG